MLKALGGGSVQGYRVVFGHPLPIPGSRRLLGLDPTAVNPRRYDSSGRRERARQTRDQIIDSARDLSPLARGRE